MSLRTAVLASPSLMGITCPAGHASPIEDCIESIDRYHCSECGIRSRIELMAFADECNRTAGFAAIPETTRRGRMKWLRQYEKQGGLCAICGQWRAPAEMTRDHITPRSKGGDSDWQNIQLCCRECNEKKGDRLLSELDATKPLC